MAVPVRRSGRGKRRFTRLTEITDPDPAAFTLGEPLVDAYRHAFERSIAAISNRFPDNWKILRHGRVPAIVIDVSHHAGTDDASSVPDDPIERTRSAVGPFGWRPDPDDPFYWIRYDGQRSRIGRLLRRLTVETSKPGWQEHEKRRRPGHPPPEPVDPVVAERPVREWNKWSTTNRTRRRYRSRRPVAVLTFDPVENAHMSTKRGWTSCMDAYTGESELRCRLERGVAVLWPTDEDDVLSLDHPSARTAFDVLFGRYGGTTLDVGETYGEVPQWWDRVVREVVETFERVSKPGIYEPASAPSASMPTVYVRVAGDPAEVLSRIAREVEDIDPKMLDALAGQLGAIDIGPETHEAIATLANVSPGFRTLAIGHGIPVPLRGARRVIPPVGRGSRGIRQRPGGSSTTSTCSETPDCAVYMSIPRVWRS